MQTGKDNDGPGNNRAERADDNPANATTIPEIRLPRHLPAYIEVDDDTVAPPRTVAGDPIMHRAAMLRARGRLEELIGEYGAFPEFTALLISASHQLAGKYAEHLRRAGELTPNE